MIQNLVFKLFAHKYRTEKAIRPFMYLIFSLFIFVSEITLASPLPNIDQDLKEVYEKYKDLSEGKNADYIPELEKVNPKLFAIVVITAEGRVYSIGDVEVPFAIESISKPFVYALALKDQGEKSIEDKIGLDPTGLPFNSVIAIELLPNHQENPLVNAGAIQITSLIKGKNSEEKWQRVLALFQELSDGKPYLGKRVYTSEARTNQHNRAIALLLDSYQRMYSEPFDAVERYTKACSIMVTARQLALMAAVLANNGVNPMTHQSIISPRQVEAVLAVMTMAGLYEASGAWWVHVGLPGKSGIGGGMIAVAPAKMAIAVYSPPLDQAGNSVRGQKVIEELSKKWNLNLLGYHRCEVGSNEEK